MIGCMHDRMHKWVAALLALSSPVFVLAQAPRAADRPKQPVPTAVQARNDATPIWTDHLKLVTYLNDAAVAPGGRTALMIDIEPGEGMHVYAPGAESYRIVTLTVTAQPFVRTLPIQYPRSEIYVFEPLNERIPVYQKPFTLRQDVVLDTHAEAQAAFRGKRSLTVTGTLEYQACDDRICFNPVSVPLTWTLPLGPAARQPNQPPGRR
jgi:DsbC/DsbD-like thiol-disulfide interchange protein